MEENMSVATQPLAPQPEAAVRMIEPIIAERPVEDTQALVAGAQIVEHERVGTIYDLASRLGLERTFAEDMVQRGVSLEEARRVILDKVAETSEQTRIFPHVSIPLGAVMSGCRAATPLPMRFCTATVPASFLSASPHGNIAA